VMLPDTHGIDQPLRKSAQRLRWFVGAFERQVTQTEAQTGNTFAVDKTKLTLVFTEWLKAFDAQKPRLDDDNPAYVAFCLNVRGLVLEADFQTEQQHSKLLSEARAWWSFRENVNEDPSLAIAFLDLFAGDEPEWTVPQLFRTGRVRELAGRFYNKEVIPYDAG
jgi:hypothetical protein